MTPRFRGYKSVSITMPSHVLKRIDDLVGEVQLSRSEVITHLCEYCLDDDEIINEIYPFEEEEDEEEEED